MTQDEIDALNDGIVDAAGKPAEAEADGRRMKARPIPEAIAAAKHAEARAVTGSAWGGALRPARVVLPGTVGPRNTEQS